MKLILQLQLLPTLAQAALLRETMAAFNGAASYVAQVGFEAKVYGQPGIHKRKLPGDSRIHVGGERELAEGSRLSLVFVDCACL